MKEIHQPGMHPDADQLSTFVEGAASPHEREQMLAHMAECVECRRVVFLMQGQVETQPLPAKIEKAWTWRWLIPTGLAGAALACGLATVVYLRTHRDAGKVEDHQAELQAPAVMPKPEAPVKTSNGETAAPMAKRRSEKARGTDAAGGASGEGNQAIQTLGIVSGLVSKTGQNTSAPVITGEDSSAKGALVVAGQAPQSQPPKPATAPVPQSFASDGNMVLKQLDQGHTPDGGISSVSGKITDQAGAVVAGATVTLRDALGATRQTTSGADGSFNLAAVPPGHYELRVMAQGFQPYQQTTDLKASEMAVLDAPLVVGTASQTVTVQSASPELDTSAASAAEIQVAQLPSEMPTQATVTVGNDVLSLDSADTLFVSRNGGKSWKKVKPQWTGKVARIELSNAEQDLRKRKKADTEYGRPVFQLTTDAGAVWISDDGAHWRAR